MARLPRVRRRGQHAESSPPVLTGAEAWSQTRLPRRLLSEHRRADSLPLVRVRDRLRVSLLHALMAGTLIWDFDGTLGRHEGAWSACMLEAVHVHEAGHGVDDDDLRQHLSQGFPWHEADVAHPELCDPVKWWAHVEALMAKLYEALGYEPTRASDLAVLAHRAYLDTTSGRWSLFEDTLTGLDQLTSLGWRHIVLSNYVPELPEIAFSLGLEGRVEGILASANIGYEKPHPAAFAIAIGRCSPKEPIWMIGDNLEADVRGAEALGIPAILMQGEDHSASRRGADMQGVAAIVGRAFI